MCTLSHACLSEARFHFSSCSLFLFCPCSAEQRRAESLSTAGNLISATLRGPEIRRWVVLFRSDGPSHDSMMNSRVYLTHDLKRPVASLRVSVIFSHSPFKATTLRRIWPGYVIHHVLRGELQLSYRRHDANDREHVRTFMHFFANVWHLVKLPRKWWT